MKLHPMSTAPKDREIFAVYLNRGALGDARPESPDWMNWHPIQWKERPWDGKFRPHWGMRWNEDFRVTLGDYGGWIDPKEMAAAVSSYAKGDEK